MGEVLNMLSYQIDDLVFSEFLPEMFKRVGLSASDINDLTKVPNWFLSNSWTEKDESDFKDWLVRRLMFKMKMSRKLAESQANMFVLNWGWTTGVPKQLELPLGDK